MILHEWDMGMADIIFIEYESCLSQTVNKHFHKYNIIKQVKTHLPNYCSC